MSLIYYANSTSSQCWWLFRFPSSNFLLFVSSLIVCHNLFSDLVSATNDTRNMSWSVSQSTVRLLGLCVFYLIYLFMGAAVFSAIEFSNERELIEELKTKRLEFLQRNKKCLNGKWTSPVVTLPIRNKKLYFIPSVKWRVYDIKNYLIHGYYIVLI